MEANDVLLHYGIVGMKWGVRRTPEELGHRKPKTTVEGQKIRYDSPSAMRVRQTAKSITATIGIRSLAYLAPFVAIPLAMAMNRETDKYYDVEEYDQPHTKLSELKRKPDGTSDDISIDVGKANKTGKRGYVNNCLYCVCALEMRQRGYDVIANPKAQGTDKNSYLEYFKGITMRSFPRLAQDAGEKRKAWVERNYNLLCDTLEKEGPNARGFLGFAYENATSGHTIMWATDSKGAVSFYDPQSGNRNATNVMSLSDQRYYYGRLDTATPTDKVTQAVTNRKEGKR